MYNHNLFSKKKKSYTLPLIILCLALILLGFGFWMSQDNNSSNDTQITKKIDNEKITDNLAANKEQFQNKKDNPNLEVMKEELTDSEIPKVQNLEDEENMVKQASKPYYLVKEVDGLIRLYHYSAQGEEKVIRITGIPYELLSETDQELFKTGVMKYSIEELNDLLQDFES